MDDLGQRAIHLLIPHAVARIELLLLIAAIVAIVSRKLRVPYSVGLVATGIALSYAPSELHVQLTRELIFGVLLPPLVFEAALALEWRALRRDLGVVLTLATVGVVLSATVTALGMHFLSGWTWSAAAILGVLVAATDPVSVIAVFKAAGMTGRLRLLVEAESLFNDGTAAVLFAIGLAVAGGHELTALGISASLVTKVGGGVLCGAAIAGVTLLLAGRTGDHLVEITLTTVAAYGSFLLAEHFDMSGVLSTLTAGLVLGNFGPRGAISAHGREAVTAFWEYVAFVANGMIFLLIGVQGASQRFTSLAAPLAVAVVFSTLGRATAIYPLCALFARSDRRVRPSHQHLLFWGGLRGALALALALGLPDDFANREAIIAVTFGVVAFSLFAQGLTITPILRRVARASEPVRAVQGAAHGP